MKNNWLIEIIIELFNFAKDIVLKFSKLKPVIDTPPVVISNPIVIPEPEQSPEVIISARERLYEKAKALLSPKQDVSPLDLATDEFGCADSVNNVYFDTFGKFIATPGISTTQLYKTMLSDTVRFKKVPFESAGCIIVSPTGYGNGKIPNGHIGIIGKLGIMSNNSSNGLWTENFTFNSWRKRYQEQGGYPIYFFEPL